jgi:hypothetical protein
MKFYKSFWNSNSNRVTTQIFLGVWESAFVMFGGLFLLVLDPVYFGGP